MNSARDKAENIIDELQAFLNQQQSRDDEPSSPSSDIDGDLDLSQSYTTATTTTLVNGHGRHVERTSVVVTSSDGSSSSANRSKLAGSSEVLMNSGSATALLELQKSSSFATTAADATSPSTVNLNLSHVGGDVVLSKQTVVSVDLNGVNDDGTVATTNGNSSGLSSSVSSTSSLEKKTKNTSLSSSTTTTTTTTTTTVKNGGESPSSSLVDSRVLLVSPGVEMDRPQPVTYDFLEPSASHAPPPALRVQDSPSMPFPIIFRRSKKDPGSKQYSVLVKELEQVLDKRNKLRRSKSMRDGPEPEDAPEAALVGTLRGAKKRSSSTDNLSVFSNKALLNRLETHFKNRGSPPGPVSPLRPVSPPPAGGGGKVTEVASFKAGRFEDAAHRPYTPPASSDVTHGRAVSSSASTETHAAAAVVNSARNWSLFAEAPPAQRSSVSGGGWGEASGGRATGGSDSRQTAAAISVINVPALAATPATDRLSVPSAHESFSKDISFGSEDDVVPLPAAAAAATDSLTANHNNHHHQHQQQHYRKHVTPRLNSHSHHPRVNARSSHEDVTSRHAQTLDRNFRHITRIAVSRSADSLPEAFRQEAERPGGRPSPNPSPSPVPMKTIVEHYSETDSADVAAWNAALRNNRKSKEKGGVYRSLSQRMVQKIYRFVRPKSSSSYSSSSRPALTSSSAVTRSASFLHRADDSRQVRATQYSGQAAEKFTGHVSTLWSGRDSGDGGGGGGGVKDEQDRLYVAKGLVTSGSVHSGGDLVAGPPTIPHYAKPHSVATNSSSSLSPPPGVAASHGNNVVGGEGSALSAGGLTIQLPDNHTAAIVPVSTHPVHVGGGDVTVRGPSPSHHPASHSAPPGHGVRTAPQQQQQHGMLVANGGAVTVQLPNRHTASIVATSPLPSNVSTNRHGTLQVSVSPQRRSASTGVSRSSSSSARHRHASGQKGSPFTQEIGEGVLPPAYGDGLHRGEEDKPAVFYIDSRGMNGEPTVQVDGPNSIAKCSIDPQPDGQYAVTYVPVEVGMFDVVVKWNGKELPASPYHPKVVCARKVLVLGGWQHYMDGKERVHLVVNEEKQIPFEVSEAGPGKMTAEVKGPSGLVPVTVDDSMVGRSTVVFTPREEGLHYIHLYWSDTPLTSSPFTGYATSGVLDPSKVILTGRGLKEAIVREEAEFYIDASQAGTGNPEVQLTGVRAEVSVFTTPLGGGKFRCTYIAVVPGAYLLHITWNNRQLRGSPYKVNVIGAFYPNKVVVSGDGLKGGLLGRDLDIRIDTRKAGPGELTAYCMGPTKVAHCELEDHHDGTFRLIVRPQEVGRHVLQVKYGGEHVLGSPFAFKVSAQPDASKVRVSGPGVEHGILPTFQSRFVVETRGAGAGQLTVRIRGPKGAFQVEMYRDSQKDRTILCRYDPTETGLYIISVRWSGVDVPGSPFHVHILDTQAELEQVLSDQSFHHNNSFHSSRAGSGYGQWREEF